MLCLLHSALTEQPDAKKRRINKLTKKIGCQSKMNVKIREVYPEYFVGFSNVKHQTMKTKTKIRQALKSKLAEGFLSIRKETWYFVQASLEHNHEISVENLPIHQELKSKIEELVNNGITSIPTIKFHLEEKVKEMFKDAQVPDASNTAFFPKCSVIKNQVYRVQHEGQVSTEEEDMTENLGDFVIIEEQGFFTMDDEQEDFVMNSGQGDLILNDKQDNFIMNGGQGDSIINDGERDFIMNGGQGDLIINDGERDFTMTDGQGDFITNDNKRDCTTITEALSNDTELNKDHNYIEKNDKKLSRAKYKHPKCLILLRKKLKNIIQLSYKIKINDGEHINHILQKISSIEEELSQCPKKYEHVDNN